MFSTTQIALRVTTSLAIPKIAALFLALSLNAAANASDKGLPNSDNPLPLPLAESKAEALAETETIPLTPIEQVRAQFIKANPNARTHTLSMPMNASDEADAFPALVLEKMIVGSNSILIEVRGLPVPARKVSAVINFNSLKITNDKGQSGRLISVQGAEQLKDKRGLQAILIKPNTNVQLIFEVVDDSRPMKIEHQNERGINFVYFEKIDPRFRERYDIAYKQTLAVGVTPEQLKDFLVEFAGNDPDGRSKEVFLKLITAMRMQNTFEGFYNAYLLIQDPADGNKAWTLAKTGEQRTKVEHIALTALVDKNRMINFDFQMKDTKSSGGEEVNSGFFGATLSFLMGKDAKKIARKELAGVLTASLKPDRPIPLIYGSYRFRFAITAVVPRFQTAQGFTATPTGTFDLVVKSTATLQMAKGVESASVNVSLGNIEIAYLDRGMAGGFTARYVSSDGKIEVKLVGIDIVESVTPSESVSAALKPINFQDLSRSGFSALKSLTVAGLQRDADEWFKSFGSVDTSERKASQVTIDNHRRENDNCNANQSCFTEVSRKSNEVVIRCLAGFDKGHTQYIRVERNGYDCTSFIVTSCKKTLREAAMSRCGLRE